MANTAGSSFSIYKIIDHSPEVIQEMKEQVEKAMKAIGVDAERYAKQESPVDTSRLKNSIAWATSKDKASGGGRDKPHGSPEELSVYIGSNVKYAIYVEYGDYSYKVGKKHFLRDAMANHVEHYKEILEAALRS